MFNRLIKAGIVWVMGALAVNAQGMDEKILPLDAQIAEDGGAVELNWFAAKPPRVGSVTVKRRLYGQLGGESWQTIATGLGPVMRYRDDTIKPGMAYEYQVLRSARDIVDVGYWVAGTDLPALAQRGNAYVIVDETVEAAIAPRLARFERDLTGDGWRVQRHPVPRGEASRPANNLQTILAIKTWLLERYNEDPFGQHAIILVGHVPIIMSGKANPDGHQAVPHATDLFYADQDGRWRIQRSGVLLDNRVPGDFIEMQIGRIDFSNVSNDDRDTEIRLLRAYFDKNHHWRMGMLGDLRGAYGIGKHLDVEFFALRNIVGPDAVVPGGHHDVGEERPWLWGVDFGDRQGGDYAAKYANKAVFAINFGSGKQKIGSRFNPMTAHLAQPWYTLAVGWGARPSWWLHHMALGGSIGDVHMRTVNNGAFEDPYRDGMDYYPPGRYLFRNPVWVNLLGDPTLRAFVLSPATDLTAQAGAAGVELSWTPSMDPDVLGYRIFRADPGSLQFEDLNDGKPVEGTSFTDPDAGGNARYMVRAVGLKHVYAGSFHTLSQGAFATVGPGRDLAQDFVVTTPSGTAVNLPQAFGHVTDGVINSFVEGPGTGRLEQDGTDWIFTPPDGFTGEVVLRFSASDQWVTDHGSLTVEVRN